MEQVKEEPKKTGKLKLIGLWLFKKSAKYVIAPAGAVFSLPIIFLGSICAGVKISFMAGWNMVNK